MNTLRTYITVIMLAAILSGCKTQYVPVETVRTEYKTKTDTFIQKDSVHVKDSVFIHAKGDTVWYEKWHTKYVDRWQTEYRTDTIIRTDVIQVPYPVERKLTKWERFCIDYGKVTLGASIVMLAALLFIIARWLSQLRRNKA